MATYIVGDIQGCFTALSALLKKVKFDHQQDRLWCTGDLVNRGPQSLDVLEFCCVHASSVQTVLGNHDIYLLGRLFGVREAKDDTIGAILASPRRDYFRDWLRQRPLLIEDPNIRIVHAGLYPTWHPDYVRQISRRIEQRLAGNQARDFLHEVFTHRYQSPKLVHDSTSEELFSLRALTTIRCVDRTSCNLTGSTGPLDEIPNSEIPWFDESHAQTLFPTGSQTVAFGHWAALGVHRTQHVIGLDSGCVWGRELSALRLDDDKIISVPATGA